MRFDIPVNVGEKVYTIESCKIEEYYVEGFVVHEDVNASKDVSKLIYLKLERYKNTESGSCKTTKALSLCFKSKQELIENLQ